MQAGVACTKTPINFERGGGRGIVDVRRKALGALGGVFVVVVVVVGRGG